MYTQTSPYYTTGVFNNEFLDVMVNRPIVPAATDKYWEISRTYHMRPDMLAYDLYNDSRLWWVFAQRNPNKLKDPVFDFSAGTSIYLPQWPSLKESLGL